MVDHITPVMHLLGYTAISVSAVVLIEDPNYLAAFDGPLVGLEDVVVVESGSGHPLDLQKESKPVCRP